jgi:hypothetical protein
MELSFTSDHRHFARVRMFFGKLFFAVVQFLGISLYRSDATLSGRSTLSFALRPIVAISNFWQRRQSDGVTHGSKIDEKILKDWDVTVTLEAKRGADTAIRPIL